MSGYEGSIRKSRRHSRFQIIADTVNYRGGSASSPSVIHLNIGLKVDDSSSKEWIISRGYLKFSRKAGFGRSGEGTKLPTLWYKPFSFLSTP
jgi:hypothetical protein